MVDPRASEGSHVHRLRHSTITANYASPHPVVDYKYQALFLSCKNRPVNLFQILTPHHSKISFRSMVPMAITEKKIIIPCKYSLIFFSHRKR